MKLFLANTRIECNQVYDKQSFHAKVREWEDADTAWILQIAHGGRDPVVPL